MFEEIVIFYVSNMVFASNRQRIAV